MGEAQIKALNVSSWGEGEGGVGGPKGFLK